MEIAGLKIFAIASCIFEVILLILFATCTKYGESASADQVGLPSERYGYFGDVHVMIFIGFGFLMTFLKKYGLSSVGLNLFLAAISIEWVILMNGFWTNVYITNKEDSPGEWTKIPLNIEALIEGDFGAAVILITFGALLGKTSPLQLLVVTFFEVIFYTFNKMIGERLLKVVDHGGTIIIHTFGAFFGLAAALIYRQDGGKNNSLNSSTPVSDLFTLVGTLFLWIFWPSFNAALNDTPSMQQRAILNTVLCLCSSTCVTFAASVLLRSGKLNIVDIENSSLAGGVAMGSSVALAVYPGGAITIGIVAGLFSVLGYVDLQPFLWHVLGLHDTCGVHNLHGMPGVIGGIISAIVIASCEKGDYGDEYNKVIVSERSPSSQAAYQIATLGVTLGISIVGGLFTGILLRVLSKFTSTFYDDSANYS